MAGKGFRLEVDQASLSRLTIRLKNLAGPGARKAIRKSADKVGKELLAGVKSRAIFGRYSTGMMKKSLGKSVKFIEGKAVVRVAPRSLTVFDRKTQTVRRIKAKWAQVEKQDPRKYAHLVEKGTSRSAAHPFMRPALDALAPSIPGIYGTALQEQINAAGFKP